MCQFFLFLPEGGVYNDCIMIVDTRLNLAGYLSSLLHTERLYNLFYVVCLQYIPMSVLYGVFLFMGVASVKGIQVTIYLCIIDLR